MTKSHNKLKFATSIMAINTSAIKHNYLQLSQRCNAAAVIKANAYGLKIKNVTPPLLDAGCRVFFVATILEAIKLHKIIKKYNSTLLKNIKIHILNGFVNEDDFEYITKYNLIPVLNSLSQIKLWTKNNKQINKNLPCVLHIDTGMNRLGITEQEIKYLKNNSHLLHDLNLTLVMTHLCCSEQDDNKENTIQNERFLKAIDVLKLQHIPKSLSATNAFIHQSFNYDLVRFGHLIYGYHHKNLNEKSQALKLNLKPAVTLFAKIIEVQQAQKNEHIGYKTTYKFDKTTYIAKVAFGYIDGLMRKIYSDNTKFKALYKNHYLPLIGNISMDSSSFLIDETKIKNPKELNNEWIVLAGKNNELNQYIENERELFCSINNRCIRLCHENDDIDTKFIENIIKKQKA